MSIHLNMDVTSTSSSKQGSRLVTTAIDDLRLIKTDAASIHAVSRDYNQYPWAITKRAQQIIEDGIASTDIAEPLQRKFCVQAKCFQFAINFNFIANVTSYSS